MPLLTAARQRLRLPRKPGPILELLARLMLAAAGLVALREQRHRLGEDRQKAAALAEAFAAELADSTPSLGAPEVCDTAAEVAERSAALPASVHNRSSLK